MRSCRHDLHALQTSAQLLTQLRLSEAIPESAALHKLDSTNITRHCQAIKAPRETRGVSTSAAAATHSTASLPERVPSFAKKWSEPKVSRAASSLGGGAGGCGPLSAWHLQAHARGTLHLRTKSLHSARSSSSSSCACATSNHQPHIHGHVTRSRLLMHWLGVGGHLGVHRAAAAIMNKVELTITCGMKQSSRTHHVTHNVPPACSVARVAAKKRGCGA
jgi:hypothetical protein